jgi:hypothetical protein
MAGAAGCSSGGRPGGADAGLTDDYDIATFTAVRLVASPDIAAWLGTRPAMEWDAGNSTKSQTKHGFHTADVESILDAPVLFAGRIVEPAQTNCVTCSSASRRAVATRR